MKKTLAIFLALITALTCFNLTAFAEEITNEGDNYEPIEQTYTEYDIYESQYILKHFGYFDADCTGTLGDITKTSLKSFQDDIGVDATGEPDFTTLASIRAAGCATATVKVRSMLYVKESPNSLSEAVDVLMRSSLVYIYSELDGWYHVETESGMQGFVPVKYLEKGEMMGIQGKIVDIESTANIREKADATAKVVANLENSTEVTVLSGSGDWFEILYNDKKGYIFKKYISIGSDHGASTTVDTLFSAWKGSSNTSSLKIRSGPSTGYDVLATISKKTAVTVIGESGNWYYVQLANGVKGFAYKDYIQKGSGYSTCTITGVSNTLNIRSGPGTTNSVVTSVANGTVLTLLDDSQSWYKVKTSDGKEGYVSSEYVKLGGTIYTTSTGLTAPSGTFKRGSEGNSVVTIQKRLKELGYFTASATGYYGSATESAVKKFQSRNSLSADGICNQKTISVMFSSSAKKAATSSSSSGSSGGAADVPGANEGSSGGSTAGGNSGSSLGQQIAEYSKNFLGRPYILGANGPNSFDCSGFTKYVYAHFGITLPRTAYQQGYNGPGKKVTSISQLQIGDLVFWNTLSDNDLCDHVGIYLGNNQVIHAASGSSRKVIISSFSTSYYTRNFSWGRHVV